MNYILPLLLLFFGMTNILIVNSHNFPLISSIFAMVMFLTLPGVLLIFITGTKLKSLWEGLSLSVGLSVGALMVIGLMINYILPQFRILPLTKIAELTYFDYFILLLFGVNFYKFRKTNLEFHFERRYIKKKISLQSRRVVKFLLRLSYTDIFLLLTIPVFPLLSVLGSVSLNNGGENFFTMLMLGGVGVYVFILVFLHKKYSENIFPAAIYFIGLALLFMTSLRGWFLTGHDVQFEYYIFQLTKSHQYWNIDFYRDAYNACLSITILPTMLSHFLNVSDVYVYKVIFQIVFAFCPVVVYLLIKKYVAPILAFFAAFNFIVFPTFVSDMPMLNRQEIAFLFFALILLIIFKSEKIKGRVLFLSVFSFGLVVSHYSTNYIAILLLGMGYVLAFIPRLRWLVKFMGRRLHMQLIVSTIKNFSDKKYIPLMLIVILIEITVLWNGLITNTLGDLTNLTNKTTSNIAGIFKHANRSTDTAYSLFSSYQVSDEEYLKTFREKLLTQAKDESIQDFYDQRLTANIKQSIRKKDLLPLTTVGTYLKNKGINVFNVNYMSRQFLAKLIQVLVVLGLVRIVFMKSPKKFDMEYLVLSVVSVFLIALMVVLPGLSVSYGLLRLFQQTLTLLGLPVVFGSFLFLVKFKRINLLYAVVIVSLFYLLNLSGFLSEITGGYYPQLNLRNGGLYFEAYYAHNSEVASIEWLSSNMVPNSTVQTDPISRNKLLAYGNIPTLNGAFAETFMRSAYVYAGFFNASGNMVVSTDRSLVIKFPTDFLDNNKDVIYNNGLSKIYR